MSLFLTLCSILLLPYRIFFCLLFKKKASPAKKPRKVQALDSESDEEDELMVEEEDDDSGDNDFQPNNKSRGGNKDDDSDDSDDDDNNFQADSDSEEDEQQQPKKKQKKTKTTNGTKASTTKKKATTPKRKATVKKEVKKDDTEQQPSGPPKYHPPSSQITTHIPYLLQSASSSTTTSSKIQLSHETKSDIPKLPNDDPNFMNVPFTPNCLEGLTFVFSGILSTNDTITSETNAAISIASPTKSDYFINRNFDCAAVTTTSGSNGTSTAINCELSRDTAIDIIKILGGKVTTSVSGKTNYLICGNILEDGRPYMEGSKYRKCMELWSAWRDKHRADYTGEDDSDDDDDEDKGSDSDENDENHKKKKEKKKANKKPKKLTAAQKKAQDPNSIVEVIRGIYEFYGLVSYLSDWKKSTLPEEERVKLEEACQAESQTKGTSSDAAVKKEVKAEGVSSSAAPAAAVSNPYAAKAAPANPYAKKPGAAGVANPYAKKPVASNPYAKSAGGGAAAAKKTFSSGNPYAGKPNTHPGSGKELRENALWADKYAPTSSQDILGNADSVNKIKRWLNSWEQNWNNPKKKTKGLTNPGGPWKAALLSGPPGIGKFQCGTTRFYIMWK